MTDSMIPYSFIPGTKAKASEVNANFIALANLIANYKAASTDELTELSKSLKDDITEILENKADKSDLSKEEIITEPGTNLNNYKVMGTYVFSSEYTPSNIPKGTAGMLIVKGSEQSMLKQIWISDDRNPEIFIRRYKEDAWQSWDSTLGQSSLGNTGYIKLPNNFKIQWGARTGSDIIYPLAYTSVAVPLFQKHGWASNYDYSDTGFITQTLTGFQMGTMGIFSNMNWIAIGY